MDTKSKITPGPWEVDSGMVQTVYDHDCNTPGCGVKIPIAYMDRKTGNGTMPCERDANARAIAAVPDLIAALEHALRDVKCRIYMLPVDGGIEGAMLKAQSERYEAALAKAGA